MSWPQWYIATSYNDTQYRQRLADTGAVCTRPYRIKNYTVCHTLPYAITSSYLPGAADSPHLTSQTTGVTRRTSDLSCTDRTITTRPEALLAPCRSGPLPPRGHAVTSLARDRLPRAIGSRDGSYALHWPGPGGDQQVIRCTRGMRVLLSALYSCPVENPVEARPGRLEVVMDNGQSTGRAPFGDRVRDWWGVMTGGIHMHWCGRWCMSCLAEWKMRALFGWC